MQLSKYFTYEEAVTSQTAARHGIDNTPNAEMLVIIQETAVWMDAIRELLGFPIIVTSWYRSPMLEQAITGSPYSKHSQGHHPKGCAVDFICPGFGTPFAVATRLEEEVYNLNIGQLIYEYGTWIHISRLPVPNPVNRVITGNRLGWHVGIVA